jgi:hypothetical protein
MDVLKIINAYGYVEFRTIKIAEAFEYKGVLHMKILEQNTAGNNAVCLDDGNTITLDDYQNVSKVEAKMTYKIETGSL